MCKSVCVRECVYVCMCMSMCVRVHMCAHACGFSPLIRAPEPRYGGAVLKIRSVQPHYGVWALHGLHCVAYVPLNVQQQCVHVKMCVPLRRYHQKLYHVSKVQDQALFAI
jgi:hypothetical protein